jgi:hypothetical protein
VNEDKAAEAADTETKLDQIIADEFADFEARVDAAIEEKVGRVISSRTASRIRAALGELTSLLSEAGVPTDTTSVERQEQTDDTTDPPESTTEETPQATSETDSEPTAPSERELVLASLSDIDTFLLQKRR